MDQTLRRRRGFVKKTVAGTAAILTGGILPGFSKKSYEGIIGANEKIRVSLMGVNSRGTALARNFAFQDQCEVIHVCDVDSRATRRCVNAVEKVQQKRPLGFEDFRLSLESKDIDALVIAAPDHWHAPASLLALKAGKHVYVEKPCSHNPAEGEVLVAAGARYGKVIQMGAQRRSWPNVISAISALKSGVIGRVYFGKGWYSNNRGPIGTGRSTDVPEWLNWDLWQGPAPRLTYKDNIVHYNWHWFWHWGTGEALNNGTHMIDLLRWGMGVDYPIRVGSSGGRYRYEDDWETPDTQVITMDFDDNLSMVWEGRSCNGMYVEGSSVGAMFYGENGSLLITGGNSFTVFDLDNNMVEKVEDQREIDPRDQANPAGHLDALHIRNFFNAMKGSESPHADIVSGHKSVLLLQLGNISQRVGRSLSVDGRTGRILNDANAQRLWGRQYEKGWEMKL